MKEFYQFSINHSVEILILGFLTITFLQSGIDKLTDWKGNSEYINSVFEKTFLNKTSGFLLVIITISELIGGLLTLIGIFQIYFYNDKTLGLLGAIVCAKVLLALLFGQRVAKDYAGAMTIAVYFIIAILGVFFLQFNM